METARDFVRSERGDFESYFELCYPVCPNLSVLGRWRRDREDLPEELIAKPGFDQCWNTGS
jgi:hypothetical protein